MSLQQQRVPQWQLILDVLLDAGVEGVTGMELAMRSGLLGYRQRVDDLRKKGYVIECDQIQNGPPRVSRYRLVERGADKGTQIARSHTPAMAATDRDTAVPMFAAPACQLDLIPPTAAQEYPR